MHLQQFLSKQSLNHLSKLTSITRRPIYYSTIIHSSPPTPPTPNPTFQHHHLIPITDSKSSFLIPNVKFMSTSANPVPQINEESEDHHDESDDTINEFLSRFVHIMRGKLNDAYPDSDKKTIDAMLVVIVDKVVEEMEEGSLVHMLEEGGDPPMGFSEDLWRTVWEVSVAVCEDMDREDKKEKMKKFLQCDEVKEMVRFASEVGIRGDMLRELRFKWAREKMEESDFYEELRVMREEEKDQEEVEGEEEEVEGKLEAENEQVAGSDGLSPAFELPKRHGKIKYKIYGLDLSDPAWAEVADKVHEAEEVTWPQEAKPVMGKAKLIMDKIISLTEADDLSALLAEWMELVQPSRADWNSLLEKCKERSMDSYLKVAEHALGEPSFQTSIGDFTKLIDSHAKENRPEDAERILEKMNRNGIKPDTVTLLVLFRMYCKAGKLELMKTTFDTLRKQGYKPDINLYGSMINAYADEGNPKSGLLLLREMENRGLKPKEESFMALLRAFSQNGDANGAQNITNTMTFAGFELNVECFALLIEACARRRPEDLAKNPGERSPIEQGRAHFDYMMRGGIKPDDRCTASILSLYETKNMLDKAVDLLLQLEKDGFEPGVRTYTVLVDWFGKLRMIDEAEKLLGKIALLGEAPPLSLQVSLCDMYSRAGNEKKALQALGVLESKKSQLGKEDFERITDALTAGKFEQHAIRISKLMESLGFKASEQPVKGFTASLNNAVKRPGFRGLYTVK